MSISAYAAFSKSDKIRFKSSSGGLFSEFAKYIYYSGGYVVGAAFDKDFKSISHIITDNPDELDRLTGSKYLQSKFSIHKEIKEILENGKTVLCCGTPCQIAGLKSYLKSDYENLITIDFICHGTPIQKVWKKYLEWQEGLHKSSVISVNFRSKENGWSNYLLLLLFTNGKKYAQTSDKDPYMQLFLSDMCLNRNCYNCQFKGKNRQSDITLGDFWGIDNIAPDLNDSEGISFLSINTQKGKELLNNIKSNIFLTEVDEEIAFSYNVAAIKSASQPDCYNNFIKDLEAMPFNKLARKYIRKSPIKKRLKKYKLIKIGIKIRDNLLKR